MIGLPSSARVSLAVVRTDMRKGFDGLAAAVQERVPRRTWRRNGTVAVAG